MNDPDVKTQTAEVYTFLDDVSTELNSYLDRHSLADLLGEVGCQDPEYYRVVLKALRRLAVLSEEAKDSLYRLIEAPAFKKKSAERTLYRIYHKCIHEFFSPKEDPWYENSRAVYVGKSSLTYHDVPPESIQKLLVSLEERFHTIREELEYYGNDDLHLS
ncbi:YpuI family protein [Halobacillus salinarum]|uniref:YpuI family protein n=1 Tax=Halobacillus salinarum TaxID=2932257 RepID=A0ABY4EGU2_9BACI|nr:DUF3907 family protein [Halobacillus salinarum]UOQ42662.1 YpuI family protein [Halobacillus salinarum]